MTDILSEQLKDARITTGSHPGDNNNLIIANNVYKRLTPDDKKYVRSYADADDIMNHRNRHCIWLPDATSLPSDATAFIVNRVNAVQSYRNKAKDKAINGAAGRPWAFIDNNANNSMMIECEARTGFMNDYVATVTRSPRTITADDVISIDKEHAYIVYSSSLALWAKDLHGDYKHKNSKKTHRKKTHGNGGDYDVYNAIISFPMPCVSDEVMDVIMGAMNGIDPAQRKYKSIKPAKLYSHGSMPTDLFDAHDELDMILDAAMLACVGIDNPFDRGEHFGGGYHLDDPITIVNYDEAVDYIVCNGGLTNEERVNLMRIIHSHQSGYELLDD